MPYWKWFLALDSSLAMTENCLGDVCLGETFPGPPLTIQQYRHLGSNDQQQS